MLKIFFLLCSALVWSAWADGTKGVEAIALGMQALDIQAESTAPTLKPFTARYKANYKFGWFDLNIQGVRTLESLGDGRWLLKFDASTTGAGFSESSVFHLENGRIIPEEYQYKASGLLNKESLHQKYNAADKTVEDLINNQLYTDIWQPGIQDNLTYILQASLDLAAGKKDLKYDFFQKNNLKNYHYQVVGIELLNTAVGTLNTVKLERMDSTNREIFVWFAVDHDYRLVRLAEYKKGKVAYEINIDQL